MGSTAGNIGQVERISSVDGGAVTVADLPPKNLKRWIARRKAEILAAVEGGLLSESEACAHYNISREEFAGWLKYYEQEGLPGLRARAKARGARQIDRSEVERAAPALILHTGLD